MSSGACGNICKNENIFYISGYKWKTSKWSDCLVSDRVCLGTSSSSFRDSSFGSRPEPVFGTRSRDVWCSKIAGDESDEQQEEHHCKEPR